MHNGAYVPLLDIVRCSLPSSPRSALFGRNTLGGLARRVGGRVVLSSITGFVNWNTQDVTDLDYTPLPLLRRGNTEDDFQFTQEVRFASADTAAVTLSDSATLSWQSGVFL